jgi:hypothetical protein
MGNSEFTPKFPTQRTHVIGLPGDRAVSTPDPLVRGLSEPGVLGPGETVWSHESGLDPRLHPDLTRSARSRQLWAKNARFGNRGGARFLRCGSRSRVPQEASAEARILADRTI